MSSTVAALTSGLRTPSARFRVRQYLAPLQERGVEVQEYIPRIDKYARLPGWPHGLRQGWAGPLLAAWQGVKLTTRLPGLLASRRHGITWLQRELLPGLPTLEPLLRGPLVFDVDDAIWLTPPLGERACRAIARRSQVVVAGNDFLADWFSRHAEDVRVLPTAIDTERFRPADQPADRPFTLGWTGLASNTAYLEIVREPLRRFLEDHRDARLLVVADRRPRLDDLPRERILFEPWSEATEAAAVRRMDVGLMPLPDTPWARGKCAFKMLQYMASGVPAVVSPVGMNAEVLALGEVAYPAASASDWRDAWEALYRDRDHALALGRRGREVAKEHFERRKVSDRLAAIFRSL